MKMPFRAVAALSALILLLVSSLLACGGSRAGVPSSGTVLSDTWLQEDLGTSTMNLRTVEHIHVRRDTLRGATGDVLADVAGAYRDQGIPVTVVEPEARLIGTVESRIRRRLGGERLTRYLSCGSTVMGDRADRYEVYLTVLTQLETLGSGTGVYTHVRASAVAGGGSGSPVRCQTRGRLEREIFQRVQRAVAGGS